MPVNQERRGPNLAAIPHATRNSRVAHLPGLPSPSPHGTLSAISEREAKATLWARMGVASARLMADNRPYTWGEMSSNTVHSKAAEKASRASKEASATKRAKKNR